MYYIRKRKIKSKSYLKFFKLYLFSCAESKILTGSEIFVRTANDDYTAWNESSEKIKFKEKIVHSGTIERVRQALLLNKFGFVIFG